MYYLLYFIFHILIIKIIKFLPGLINKIILKLLTFIKKRVFF